MKFQTYTPSKKLQGLVRFYWVFELDRLVEPYIYRSMADSCFELIFHYKGSFDELLECGKRSESVLSCIHSQTHRYRRFITDEAFGIFGVYLYPFAARQLLELSPVELTDRMPDLYSALGNQGKELEERIFLASDTKQRIQILSSFLEKQFHKGKLDDHPVISAVRHVIHSKHNHTVRELADHFNLSERQFERKFKEYSGFSPKKYLRLVRFEEVCNRYDESSKKTLSELALSCGYYDQSHFIKDFKAFSGYNPSYFFSGNVEDNSPCTAVLHL